ncbi:MAG: CHAT domain-containing protein [Sulfurovum sp.]|nr:CHAT domain-containing protein [Sulfurovum sp.]
MAIHSRFTLSRNFNQGELEKVKLKQESFRVLFFSTLPDDETTRLSVELEKQEVLKALMPFIREGKVILEIPNDGRIDSFTKNIKIFKPHLVFMSGHSIFKDGVGSFSFANERGYKVSIDEDTLIDSFIDVDVSCVVFSSCQSAQFKADDIYSGLANQLFLAGIPNVIGMGDSITDGAGILFASTFIKSLLDQESITKSLQQSREAIDKEYKDENAFYPMLLSSDTMDTNFIVDWDFTPTPHINSAISLETLPQTHFS